MIQGKLKEYLQETLPKRSPFFEEMEQYAIQYKVPIMDPYSMETLLQLLRLYKPSSILEIGTAIGYSSLRMANVLDAKIVTIERDQGRITDAKEFIKRAEKQEQITLLEGDAFELVDDIRGYGPFQCLFIDAAKGQYKRFFETFEPMLTDDCIIITDNVLFKGYVFEETPENKRLSSLGKKINHYNEWLTQHPNYHTVILPVGDGIAVSVKNR